MELKDSYFLKVNSKKRIALKNAGYIEFLANAEENIFLKNVLVRKVKRMNECLNYWEWDIYRRNKVMDLNKVSRCKDRFCPNCRSWSNSIGIFKFSSKFKELLYMGYNPYFLTLTVPNINAERLGSELDKINKSFYKMWKWLSGTYGVSNKRKFEDRLFEIMGAIKSVELTINKETKEYNLHIHAIVFLSGEKIIDFEKDFPGGYQRRTKSYIYYSNADLFIRKLWTLSYKGFSVTDYKLETENDFVCDIRELDLQKGIFEVYKYSFKDIDINNIYDFGIIFYAFRNMRLRQGYGLLYGIGDEKNGDDLSDENLRDLLLVDSEEKFEKWRTNNVLNIVNEYKEYKKYSRYKRDKYYNSIKD